MRYIDVVLALVVAFVAQTVLGHYLPFLSHYLDLFTVVVAGVSLMRGRMFGLATGTIAGLIQDSFSGGLLGLNGMVKSTVGYLAGIAGQRLIIRTWSMRALFFIVATLLDITILTFVGHLANIPVVVGEGLTPVSVCLGNTVAGLLLVYMQDKWKQDF